MAKSKHGPALFELIRGQRRNPADAMKMPTWMSANQDASLGGERSANTPELPHPRVVRPEPDELDRESSGSVVAFDGPTLRVSLTSKSGAVVLFVLLLLVVGVYALGRNAGKSQALAQSLTIQSAPTPVSEIEEARLRPPASHLVQDLTSPPQNQASPVEAPREPILPVRKNATPSPKTTWVKGNTYIVVQEFNAGQQDDARRALEFLLEHGIGSAVVTLPGGGIHLITTEGYNRKDATQASMSDDLLKRVHAVGDKYFAAGGRYRLKGYFKALKGDTW